MQKKGGKKNDESLKPGWLYCTSWKMTTICDYVSEVQPLETITNFGYFLQ